MIAEDIDGCMAEEGRRVCECVSVWVLPTDCGSEVLKKPNVQHSTFHVQLSRHPLCPLCALW